MNGRDRLKNEIGDCDYVNDIHHLSNDHDLLHDYDRVHESSSLDCFEFARLINGWIDAPAQKLVWMNQTLQKARNI